LSPKYQHRKSARSVQPETDAAVLRASDAAVEKNQIIPLDRPDETVLRYARELAKRLAREDYAAETAPAEQA
jgi:hypothetical protein